ncbi:MAG: hypothetical protein ACK5X3_06540, partial [Pseudomonadota bacterium]
TGEQIQAVDSVRGTHIFDLYQELENREFISNGSVGTFDPASPDIRYSGGQGATLPIGHSLEKIKRGMSSALSLGKEYEAQLGGRPSTAATMEIEAAILDGANTKQFLRDSDGNIVAAISYGKNDDVVEITHLGSTVDGGGSFLFAQAKEYARRSGLSLVLVSSDEAKGFYEKMGMREDGGLYRYSRGSVPDPSTSKDEIKSADEAVKRAKSYASVLRAAADKLDNDAEATAAMRAALPDITPQEIDDLLGQLRKQVTGLRSMARATRSMLDAEDTAAGMQDEAMRAADMLANNLQMAAAIEKRNAALNLNVRLKASSFVNQFRDKSLDFEGFAALLTGSQRVRSGARLSVDAEYKGFRGEWMGGMIADIEKLGLWREFVDGAFDRDIYDALHRIGTESPDFTGLPKEAVDLAKVVNKYQTDARNTRNRFGAWIRDLKGYITRQSHDMFKIRDAGE